MLLQSNVSIATKKANVALESATDSMGSKISRTDTVNTFQVNAEVSFPLSSVIALGAPEARV